MLIKWNVRIAWCVAEVSDGMGPELRFRWGRVKSGYWSLNIPGKAYDGFEVWTLMEWRVVIRGVGLIAVDRW
jgi:hypothetical protein